METAAMLDDSKPVILIVDPECDASRAVEQLADRYSRDYTIAVAFATRRAWARLVFGSSD